MQLNKQRLQLWLSGKVAAYNNGSSQDIEMIRELCKYSKRLSFPSGSAKFYTNDEVGWMPLDNVEKMAHHSVSWFFEQDESDPIEQRLEALEKAVEEIRILINNKK
jgi:hypothetical protein